MAQPATALQRAASRPASSRQPAASALAAAAATAAAAGRPHQRDTHDYCAIYPQEQHLLLSLAVASSPLPRSWAGPVRRRRRPRTAHPVQRCRRLHGGSPAPANQRVLVVPRKVGSESALAPSLSGSGGSNSARAAAAAMVASAWHRASARSPLGTSACPHFLVCSVRCIAQFFQMVSPAPLGCHMTVDF